MAKASRHSTDGSDPEIADVQGLIGNKAQSHDARSASRPTKGVRPVASEGGYELVDEPPAGYVPPPPPKTPPASSSSSTNKTRAASDTKRPREDDRRSSSPAPAPAKTQADPEDLVSEVWSRWGESGGALILLAFAFIGVIALLSMSLTAGNFPLTLAVIFGGGFFLILMAYPLFITLERPVRISPEQAAKDFYEALSHGFPAYRRMWLLLSDAGKTSDKFRTYAGFKSHWKRRLGAVRNGKGNAPFWNPYVFTVTAFRSSKARDQNDNSTQFEIQIRFRSADPKLPPLETVKVDVAMVKGPDKQWYLDQGILPGTRM